MNPTPSASTKPPIGIAALSSGNLRAVARTLRTRYPLARIIMLADLVRDTGQPDPHAIDAAYQVGTALAIPDFGADRQEGLTDFNDLASVAGLDVVRDVLLAALETTLNGAHGHHLPDADDPDGDRRIGCYERKGHRLGWVKGSKDGETVILLSNFAARVVEQREYDDGADVDHRSLLRVVRPGESGPIACEVEIPTAQFGGMAWVTPRLGHAYIVAAGTSTRDHLRAAIQTLSGGVRSRRIYAHTGWREVDGRLLYLHAAGAIGAEGAVSTVDVDLPDGLDRYALPPPPDPEGLRQAVRASLRQMELIDDGVGAVQLARIYGPPLASWYRLDLGVFVVGRTGSRKTELAAIAMSHYGQDFTARTLPGSWESTEGALLLRAFRAKDALLEIDDYNPSGTASDHLTFTRKADRVFRGAANGAGRDRLTPDIKLRTAHVPRGMVSSSGEDLPGGRSLRARMWVVEIEPEAVNLATLTACQADARAGLYAAAMAGYLAWLAGHADELRRSLPARYEALRTDAPAVLAEHGRCASNYAGLVTAIETFLRFATEIGALDHGEAATLRARCAAGLVGQGAAQMDIQVESEEAVQFAELLRAALGTGRVYVADGEEREATRPPPTRASSLGWRGYRHRHDDPSGETREEVRWETKGERIGYVVAGELWLDPEATVTAVARMARDQGGGALRTKRRIAKALVERGYIDRPPPGENIARKHARYWITPSRVWRIPMMRILGDDYQEEEIHDDVHF